LSAALRKYLIWLESLPLRHEKRWRAEQAKVIQLKAKRR